MKTYKVPVTIVTEITVEANNSSDAEDAACEAVLKHFDPNNCKVTPELPKTLQLFYVNCTVFVKAYNADDAQTIVDDTFNAGCRALKLTDESVITSFDIDSVGKAE